MDFDVTTMNSNKDTGVFTRENQLTLFECLLYCTDKERETLFIRDEDDWNKGTEEIQEISRKGTQELME